MAKSQQAIEKISTAKENDVANHLLNLSVIRWCVLNSNWKETVGFEGATNVCLLFLQNQENIIVEIYEDTMKMLMNQLGLFNLKCITSKE